MSGEETEGQIDTGCKVSGGGIVKESDIKNTGTFI